MSEPENYLERIFSCCQLATQMDPARPSAGTNAFIALRVPAGYLTYARTRLLSAGTPDAINAIFTSDIKGDGAMTYETAAESSGKNFQLLRVSNTD